MATIKQLQAQKARILRDRDVAMKKQKLQFEKIGLEKEIKQLRRTPSQMRNTRLAKRTAKGLRIIGKTIAAKASRQFKRIVEQQKRDAAIISRSEKMKNKSNQMIITRTITGKGKNKKIRVSKKGFVKKLKTGQNLSKVKEGSGFDVFSDLDF